MLNYNFWHQIGLILNLTSNRFFYMFWAVWMFGSRIPSHILCQDSPFASLDPATCVSETVGRETVGWSTLEQLLLLNYPWDICSVTTCFFLFFMCILYFDVFWFFSAATLPLPFWRIHHVELRHQFVASHITAASVPANLGSLVWHAAIRGSNVRSFGRAGCMQLMETKGAGLIVISIIYLFIYIYMFNILGQS